MNENNRALLMVDDKAVLAVYGDARVRTDAAGKMLGLYKTGVGGVVTETI